MSQRSQIEWLKFGRLRIELLFTRSDQCEYYCFHIFCSFLSLRAAPSVVRPLRDNYHFLFPITKSDVYIKLEQVWAKGLSRVARWLGLSVLVSSYYYFSATASSCTPHSAQTQRDQSREPG